MSIKYFYEIQRGLSALIFQSEIVRAVRSKAATEATAQGFSRFSTSIPQPFIGRINFNFYIVAKKM